MIRLRLKHLIYGVLPVLLLSAADLQACATCFGTSDSPLAKGMNWGIAVLLGVVFVVLALISAFFIFLARRSAFISKKETFTAAALNNQKVS